jgi:hypothetical protein
MKEKALQLSKEFQSEYEKEYIAMGRAESVDSE